MQYVKLGNTGLEVSRICLGCMSYGREPNDMVRPWMLKEDESRVFLKAAVEAGINYFDTADNYGDGESERVLGRFIRDHIPRDQAVITTKVWNTWRKGPNGGGLSKKNITTEVEKSLKNLGTDYIDVYMIHRYDHFTPVEETLEILNDLVRAGKVLYLGGSSMHAWELMKILGIQRANNWSQFVVMQSYYNLLYREEEREMMGMCLAEGIAVTPWSPLARGRLARPWEDSMNAVTTRSKVDGYAKVVFAKGSEELDKPIVDRVNEVAKARGVTPGQVALAWMLSKPFITSPLIGATKMNQLEEAAAAVDLKLTDEEIKLLEEFYMPRAHTDTYK